MFYHVSKKNLGNQVILEPRVPETGLMEEEGNIPHICVSTSIFHCLRSIIAVQARNFHVFNLLEAFRQNLVPMESKEDWVARGEKIQSPIVYVSNEKAYLPPNCSDFRFNKEHWFLKETHFEKIGFIDLQTLVTKGKIKVIDNFNELDGILVLNEDYKKLKVKK